ncbi:L-amino acid N-acyltransferase YncA [Prauserella shujinwangii]|uniref:L-amino acid N-acyltransferase YncA n=2 Tax=Prauserella shujinwangii TaxID=1453103 RepID=A0A2T0M2K1_9PSEU|nr:L-amino acid N-acyltransferase YncA [Prauserella shujinwangii]
MTGRPGDRAPGATGAVGHTGAMHVREATAADWPAIWPFLRRIVAEGTTYTLPRDLGEDAARAMWMLDPPGRTVVAEDGGVVVGSAKVCPNYQGPAAHVANASFLVDPGHGGRGAGRALGEYVLDLARADGYRAMQFNAVVETNTRAVALWRSLGFEIVGTVPEAFRHPEHGYVGLHVMHRRL